jgi:thioredoxin 1
MTQPIHIQDSEFDEKVLRASTPVIVEFWAPWCGPCRMIAPILEKIAGEYDQELIVAKVNTDENPEWAMKYGVQGIPTMLFIDHGQVIDRMVGAGPASLIKAKVESLVKTSQVSA